MIAGLVRRHFKAVIPLVTLIALALSMAGFGGFQQVSTDTFSVPTNVAAAAADGTITVTWTPGSGASSQVIVAVNVLDDTDYCLGFDPTGRASSHECPGLTISATYVVLVIALDGAGGYRLGKDAQGNLVTHTLVSPPVSEEVGAGEAATVAHDSGARIEVPAGATTEPTTASITEVPPPASDLEVGRVFDFSVGDVQLAAPVTVHVPFELPPNSDPSLVQAVHWNAEARQWELVPGVIDETVGAVAVSTSNLSIFSTWVIKPITAVVEAVLTDYDALESVTCSVDTATPKAGNEIQFSARITSGTFNGDVYLQTGARDNLRDVSELDIHKTAPRSIRPNQTITITDKFIVEFPGDFHFICQIYQERIGPNPILAGQPVPFTVAPKSGGRSGGDGYLTTCAPSLTEPLGGEPITLEAVGFEGRNDDNNNISTYSLAVRVYHEGDVVATGYSTANVQTIRSVGIKVDELTREHVWSGEYVMECQLVGGLVYGAGGELVSPFASAEERATLALKAYFTPSLAITGLVENLLDTKTVRFEAVPARWRTGAVDIEPPQLPAQGGSRDVTVRVYTRESRTIQHSATAPTITALLPASLVPSGAGSQQKGAVSRCGITHHDGYDEFCWEAVFAGIPESTARAEKNAAGEITETNEAEVIIRVSSGRAIAGPVPTGSITVSARPPYSDDREALLAFYEATRGEFWRNDEQHWGTERDIGDWYGVNDSSLITDTEKDSDRVISLDLNSNNLRGDLPAEVGYLTSLKFLILATNDNLRGQIPGSFGELTDLEYLDLSENKLSRQIPSTLGNLKNLKLMDLSDNNLIGEIPSNFGELPALHSLYLADNRLTGCIPAGLRDLRNDDFDDTDLPFCDVALSSLTISPGELDPAFETQVMRYSATVSEPQVSIVPVNDHAATFEYYVGSSRTPATVADPSAVGFQADLDCGKTTVRIKVISADREEDDTYTIEFTRGGVGLPAAPTIRSVSRGTGSLTVIWTAPDTGCGGTIDRYNLRYSLDQDGVDWTEVQGPSSGLSHTVSGLSAGTTYRVQAQAVNEHGAGPWSGTFVASTASDTVTQGNPDLVVDSPALGVPAPGSLEPGGSFTLSTTVRNQGNGASAAATLRYYRSTDSTISTSDTEEGTDDVSTLGASGTENETIDLTAPATAGTYYYGACVDAVANESNTQNNCSGAVAATVVEPTETEVDLSVSSPSVSRSEVGPGRRFNLNVTVAHYRR